MGSGRIGVVRQALADVRAHGVGRRYLIQHSAGSGKTNAGHVLTAEIVTTNDALQWDWELTGGGLWMPNADDRKKEIQANIGLCHHSSKL